MFSNYANIGCRVCSPLMSAVLILIISSLFLVTLSFFNIFSNFEPSELNRIYVFGSDEGQFRCTNANLVSIPSQCPSSDSCPSSPGGNTLTQCIPKESSSIPSSSQTKEENKETIIKYCPSQIRSSGSLLCPNFSPSSESKTVMSSIKSEALAISTDKQMYKMGEIVNITIENTGTEPLTFPNAILGLTVEKAVTHEKYPLFSAQVITVLDLGGAKSLRWDQMDSNGQQVGEGNYTASTSTGSLNANTTFSISQ
jgi:hypothetical protein